MHEELFNRLIFMAEHDDITITEIPGNSSDPDVAFCKDRIININYNYNSKISATYRLAHEICHIKFSNPSYLYTFSPILKVKRNVKQMNVLSVQLLV